MFKRPFINVDPFNTAVTFNVTTINGDSCHFPFYDKLTRKNYDSCGTVTTNPLLQERLGLDKTDTVGWCKTDSTSYAICRPNFKVGLHCPFLIRNQKCMYPHF